MLFSDTQQAHPCGLGKFIPEFDGLKTTSQTLHQSLLLVQRKKTTIRPDHPMAFT
jgi:hypothetical protein